MALGWWTNPGISLFVLSLVLELALFSWNTERHTCKWHDENQPFRNSMTLHPRNARCVWDPPPLVTSQGPKSLQRCYTVQGEWPHILTGDAVMKREICFITAVTLLRKQCATESRFLGWVTEHCTSPRTEDSGDQTSRGVTHGMSTCPGNGLQCIDREKAVQLLRHRVTQASGRDPQEHDWRERLFSTHNKHWNWIQSN